MSLKILINNMEAVLPVDVEIDIKYNNILFNDREEDATYPLTLNLSANRHIFGFPERLNTSSPPKDLPAIVFWGPYRLISGRCVITDINNDEIELFISTDATSFWGKCKKIRLTTLDLGRESFADISSMMTAFTQSLKGGKDYVVCPLYDPYCSNIYIDLYASFYNYLLPSDSANSAFKDRILPSGMGNCVFAPFVRLHQLIKKVFSALGYTIKSNVLDSDSRFNEILVVCRANGTSSLTLKPYFDYNKRVPDILVSDFIQEIEKKFGIRCLVNDSTHTVSIISFQHVEKYWEVNIQDQFQKHVLEEDEIQRNFIFKDKENSDTYIKEYYEDDMLEYIFGDAENAESKECSSIVVGWSTTDVQLGYINHMAIGAAYDSDQDYLKAVRSEFRLSVYRGYVRCNTGDGRKYFPYPVASPEPLSGALVDDLSLLWWGSGNLFRRYHENECETISGLEAYTEFVLVLRPDYLCDIQRFFSEILIVNNRRYRCYELEIKLSESEIVEYLLRCYPY